MARGVSVMDEWAPDPIRECAQLLGRRQVTLSERWETMR